MATNWERVSTRREFVGAFADRPLSGEDIRFVIHSDGRITGLVDGQEFSGAWSWQDGYFCRTASIGDEHLAHDCEIIERRGSQMRYVRDRGRGDASIAIIEEV